MSHGCMRKICIHMSIRPFIRPSIRAGSLPIVGPALGGSGELNRAFQSLRGPVRDAVRISIRHTRIRLQSGCVPPQCFHCLSTSAAPSSHELLRVKLLQTGPSHKPMALRPLHTYDDKTPITTRVAVHGHCTQSLLSFTRG